MKVKSFIKNFIIIFCLSFVCIIAITYLYSFIDPGARAVVWPQAVTTSITLGIILPAVKRLQRPVDDSVAGKKGMEGKLNKNGIMSILAPFRLTLASAILFFWAAGRTDIFRGWLYIGICLIGAIAGGLIMWKFAPELANHRGYLKKGTKFWDKVFLVIFTISLLLFPAVAGLDVGRFKWSQLGMPWAIPGILLALVKFILWHWAIVTNKHLEATVRIQTDRDHKVITDGPYRFVRHPGYLGVILGSLSGSFIIGSVYSLIPASIIIVAIIIRTWLEDRTLQNELAGYSEYTKKTKYRLVPRVW